MPILNSLCVFATPYDACLDTLRRKSYAESEEKLMRAVLEDAIACFQKYVFARDRKKKVLFQEAQDWIQEIDRDWPFSFVNICEVLGFRPNYLRRGLEQWKAAMVESREKHKMNRLAPRNGKTKRSIVHTGSARRRRVAS